MPDLESAEAFAERLLAERDGGTLDERVERFIVLIQSRDRAIRAAEAERWAAKLREVADELQHAPPGPATLWKRRMADQLRAAIAEVGRGT